MMDEVLHTYHEKLFSPRTVDHVLARKMLHTFGRAIIPADNGGPSPSDIKCCADADNYMDSAPGPDGIPFQRLAIRKRALSADSD